MKPDIEFAAIANGLEGFTDGGLTAELTRRDTSAGSGFLGIAGQIIDENRFGVGSFSRDLIVIPEGPWRAFHMRFDLDLSVRGGTFRPAFFSHSESVYRAHGISDIRVSAEDIGSYLWAKEGFVFMGDEDGKRAAVLDLWKTRGREVGQRAVAAEDLPSAAFAEIDRQFQEIANSVRATFEPVELARLAAEWTWAAPSGHRLWLGKEMLIGWNWNGIKTLT